MGQENFYEDLLGNDKTAAFRCNNKLEVTAFNQRFFQYFGMDKSVSAPFQLCLSDDGMMAAQTALNGGEQYFSSGFKFLERYTMTAVITPVSDGNNIAVVIRGGVEANEAYAAIGENTCKIMNKVSSHAAKINSSSQYFWERYLEICDEVSDHDFKTASCLHDDEIFSAMDILRHTTEISDYIRLADKTMPFEPCRVVMQDWLKRIEAKLNYSFARTYLKFNFELPDEPLTTEIDPALLSTAIFHIISNACRFSTDDQNVITVSLSVNENNYHIVITDTGFPFENNAMNVAYQPFRTLSEDEIFDDYGLGLGLTIASQITMLHGGMVLISSNHCATNVMIQLPIRYDKSADLNVNSVEKRYRSNAANRFMNADIIFNGIIDEKK